MTQPSDNASNDVPAGSDTTTRFVPPVLQLAVPSVQRALPTVTLNGLQDYVLAPSMRDGRLIGARWNGMEEIVALIDPLTGSADVVASLGDLRLWSGQLLYDGVAGVVYGAGTDPAGVNRLYSFSLESRASASVPLDRAYLLAGPTREGDLIGAYWNGTEEVVLLIDPMTGGTRLAGVLGDLQSWAGQPSYDDASRTVYAIGQGAVDPATSLAVSNLYSLSLDTGVSAQVPIGIFYSLITTAKVTDQGRLIGAYWDGSEEQVVVLDPATAAPLSWAGVLGDLQTWAGHLAYDAAARVYYTIGRDANARPQIYHVDVGPAR